LSNEEACEVTDAPPNPVPNAVFAQLKVLRLARIVRAIVEVISGPGEECKPPSLPNLPRHFWPSGDMEHISKTKEIGDGQQAGTKYSGFIPQYSP
jgi:hypothetical protein